jgi:dipeptidyl aminopeptidase/acylaminoacyl peptidase
VLRQPLGNGVGGAWQTDGKIVLTTAMPNTGLQSVSSDGGDFSTINKPEAPGEQDFHDVSQLPEGKGLIYVVDRGSNLIDTIAVFSAQTKKTILHLEGEMLRSPRYAASGHILYERASNNPGIWALPFSLDTLAPTGDAFLAMPQGSLPSVSRDGTLVSVRQPPAGPRELVWVDRTGKIERSIGQPLPGLSSPELTSDGARVAVSAVANGQPHIWVYDVARGTNTRLTFAEGGEALPAWSPTGNRVFFMRSPKRAIATQAADGTGQIEKLAEDGMNPTVSRDGKFLAYTASARDPQKNAQDLWYLPLDGDKKPVLFVEAPNNQTEPRFSPDGRYLAYSSAEAGRMEVYLKAFPSGDGKWQVSLNGGASPRWNKSGNRLFFFDSDQRLMEVDVTLQPALRLGTPRVLLTAPMGIVGPGWDVAPDGQRFLFVHQIPNPLAIGPAITVVENWFAEFKK